jgi:hypothetical protein
MFGPSAKGDAFFGAFAEHASARGAQPVTMPAAWSCPFRTS